MIFVLKGEDFIPPWSEKDQLVKLSFGGHVFYTHKSTLDSCMPVSMMIKCTGTRTAFQYTRDAVVDSEPAHGPISQCSDEVKFYFNFALLWFQFTLDFAFWMLLFAGDGSHF